MSKIIGDKYRFTYPDYGTPDGHPDYTTHSGQTVTVVRQLTGNTQPPMYEIKAEDGWTGSACGRELRHIKTK